MLIACEAAHVGVRYLCGCERFGPHAHFHHIAVERVFAIQTATDTQRCSIVLQYPSCEIIIGDVQRSGIEAEFVIEKVVCHYHACEVSGGQCSHLLGYHLVLYAVAVRN